MAIWSPPPGYLRYFALYPYDDGFVIQMPDQSAPRALAPFSAPEQALSRYERVPQPGGICRGSRQWAALNDRITKSGDMRDVVLVQEALQGEEDRPDRGADRRTEGDEIRPDRRAFVFRKRRLFPTGSPSSCGRAGMVPHPISVDNFFVEREDTPKDEHGNYNFECLEAVDTALFNDR